MDRRDLMRMIAASVGGTMAVPESVFARLSDPLEASDLNFFRPAQRQQVAIIAEAIIPETDTPGAIEAGVPEWIEVIVKDCYDTPSQNLIIEGISDLMNRCAEQTGASLEKLKAEDQVAFLTNYQQSTRSERNKRMSKGGWEPKPFIDLFKDLVKLCYCSSEVGATQAFEYHLVPGKWVASMPLKPGQKAWAV